MRTRDVLNACQVYRDRCVAEGRLVPYPFDGGISGRAHHPEIHRLEQAWNEHRATVTVSGPDRGDRAGSGALLCHRSLFSELETGHEFTAEVDGRFVPVEIHDRDNSVEQVLIGVCNKKAQGGGLGRQIDELVKRAGEHTVVVVRSTDYPSNPKTIVAQTLGRLIDSGGRKVVVEDSDWRTMLAFRASARSKAVRASPFGKRRLIHSQALDHYGRS